jgi:hypothetical protein
VLPRPSQLTYKLTRHRQQRLGPPTIITLWITTTRHLLYFGLRDTLDPCSVSESVRHSFDYFLPFLTCSYGGVFYFLDELDGCMVGVENRETKHRSAHRTDGGTGLGY